MSRLLLKPREERRLLRGHLWVYRNELQADPGLPDGAPVDICAANNRLVGRGFYEAAGGIAARLLVRGKVDFDTGFFAERIGAALALRETLYPGEAVYRWVYADSDGLPGIVVDRYGSVVCAHAVSVFYRGHADTLARPFLDTPGIEGVQLKVGEETLRFGAVPDVVRCTIHELEFDVDLTQGQKTGLFLDQRENWPLVAPFAPDARVLDGHCYAGVWSCHAARRGARVVHGVDTSKAAIDAAAHNARLNGVSDRCRFEQADVRAVLARGEKYDVAILDPPALAKSRGQLRKAQGLYQALNRDAMKALNPGGILITSSCSQPVDPNQFVEILKRAANAARRQAQLLGVYGAAPDHPVLLSMPETRYLTCAVVRVQ